MLSNASMTVFSIDTHPKEIKQLQKEISSEFVTEISSEMKGNEHLFLVSELKISKDISRYDSRKITVRYIQHSKQNSWKIIYSYNLNRTQLDRNITITDVSELGERVNKYCNTYLVEQGYPPKEFIEKDVSNNLTKIEEIKHKNNTHKRILLYEINTNKDTEKQKYYIQYKNPYHKEVSQYITLTSETQELQSSIKQDRAYGVICSKEVFTEALYFILAEYTQLSEPQINTKIVTLYI